MVRADISAAFKASRSFHRELDIDVLRSLLPVEPVRSENIELVGPHDILVVDHLRREAGGPGSHAVPTDVFLWAIGEPEHPAMTKIGGRPYLPSTRDWPQLDGSLASFFGQLNFVDSRDILPVRPPGDVLLVFHHTAPGLTPWDEAFYCLVWQDVSPDARLHPARDSCRPAFHGVRVRVYDDPLTGARVRAAHAFDTPAFDAGVLSATKAGGLPSPDDGLANTTRSAFLGQMGSVLPTLEVPFPFVNRPGPFERPRMERTSILAWQETWAKHTAQWEGMTRVLQDGSRTHVLYSST